LVLAIGRLIVTHGKIIRVKKLLDERKENWFLHSSGNILICGGPKYPHDHTNLEIPDLVQYLKKVIAKN